MPEQQKYERFPFCDVPVSWLGRRGESLLQYCGFCCLLLGCVSFGVLSQSSPFRGFQKGSASVLFISQRNPIVLGCANFTAMSVVY